MYEDNDYCDAGGAMWDPISDDNLSSLDPFTANQTNQKINKNGNEIEQNKNGIKTKIQDLFSHDNLSSLDPLTANQNT